jgi:large subunit ribosomal protein L18
MSNKLSLSSRQKIKFRIRSRVSGTAQKPRLSVYRSNSDLYLQLIDDVNGQTLAAASTKDKTVVAVSGNKSVKANAAGKLLAEKATALKIENVVFDRNGFLFHGRVKAAAEGAREGGLKF